MSLLKQLQHRLHRALTGLVPDPTPYAAMVKPTQDAKFGDYQANCAMSLKAVLGKPPRDIAQLVADRLELGDMLEKPEIAGPGFINLRLRSDWLAKVLQAMARDDRLGVAKADLAKTVVIDYSSPNVAKPMHVGHLRSTIIGDALARLLRFLGHTVITDNHLGDWGTQFGILLYGYKNLLDKEAFAADPVKELARLYIAVRQQFKKADEDDEEAGQEPDPVADACRAETAKLHAGDPENVRLWQQFMPHCHEMLNRIYRRLDVHFDHTHGESFYNPLLPGVVKELERQQIARPSAGAKVVFWDLNSPPAIIQKRDGAYTYTTTDLATIRHRLDQWKPDTILYVVDFRQGSHFTPLFYIGRWWLGCDTVEMEHVAFGTIMGPDKKPYKTREGDVVGLESLLDEAVARAREVVDANSPDLPPEDRARVAEVVGIAAVKYADLSQNRTSDYVFDYDKMVAMDGNTATYMQYACARISSIFRRGSLDVTPFRIEPPLPLIGQPEERALAVQLLRFADALADAEASYRPNLITAYLWDLAKTYSGFYQNCPVLKAETPELRRSRLLLCDLTARVIQKGLSLLGIQTVERM